MVSFPSSCLTLEFLRQHGFVQLFQVGYGLTSPEQAEEWLLSDVLSSLGEKMLHCVFDEHEQAVAVVITDDLGQWTINVDGEVQSLHVLELSGIVLLPSHQGKGLGKILYQKVVEEHPDVIIGISKNPVAMKTREVALRDLGFITYAGKRRVIDNEEISKTEFHILQQIIQQYCLLTQVGVCREDLVIETEPDFIPNLEVATPSKLESVQVLRNLHDKFGKSADFLLPVVSVQGSIL